MGDRIFCVKIIGIRYFYKDINNKIVDQNGINKYVQVYIGSQKRETRPTISETNGASWNELLEYNNDDIKDKDKINITIYDKNVLYWRTFATIDLDYIKYKDIDYDLALFHWYKVELGVQNILCEIGLVIGFRNDFKNSNINIDVSDSLETKQILERAIEVSNENNKIVNRLIGVADQTVNIGKETLQTLNNQTETLDRVENDLIVIDNKTIEGEESIKRMESCWSMFWGTDKSKQRIKRNEHIREKAKKRAEKERLKSQKQVKQSVSSGMNDIDNKEIRPPSISNNIGQSLYHQDEQKLHNILLEQKKQTDKGLDIIHERVQEMKQIAIDMNETIGKDIDKLNMINDIATKDIAGIKRVTDRVNRL